MSLKKVLTRKRKIQQVLKYKKSKLKEKNTNKTRKKDSVYLQILRKEGV